MQEKGFEINNNILHFVYNDSDYLIDLDQLEMMYLYQDKVVFVEHGKEKRVPSIIFDLVELTIKLLDNSNFMVCGSKHIVNMKHVKSQHVKSYKNGEKYTNQNTLVLTFTNGMQEGIVLNSWCETERLFQNIDDKLIEIKSDKTI